MVGEVGEPALWVHLPFPGKMDIVMDNEIIAPWYEIRADASKVIFRDGQRYVVFNSPLAAPVQAVINAIFDAGGVLTRHVLHFTTHHRITLTRLSRSYGHTA